MVAFLDSPLCLAAIRAGDGVWRIGVYLLAIAIQIASCIDQVDIGVDQPSCVVCASNLEITQP